MIAEDDALVDVMTDKATVELTSPVAGRVTAITGGEGDDVAVGADLVVFETDAEAPAQVPASSPEPMGRPMTLERWRERSDQERT